ncbi:uncharacterized protein TNCV_2726491 [Trichonephila clavipes]|nr:uncharacterized protein TNCV_2726491 [Trichonephila clavipes]
MSSVLRLNLDSSLKTTWFLSTAVHFPRVRRHSKRLRQRKHTYCASRSQMSFSQAPSYGYGLHCEGATCAWMAVDEAFGCTCSFLTMWQSSGRLVCCVRPEPCLRVNDISRIHRFQHLLTTQSAQPN